MIRIHHTYAVTTIDFYPDPDLSFATQEMKWPRVLVNLPRGLKRDVYQIALPAA